MAAYKRPVLLCRLIGITGAGLMCFVLNKKIKNNDFLSFLCCFLNFWCIITHCELRRDSVVWPNARAWRARLPQGNEGSNPSLSARGNTGSIRCFRLIIYSSPEGCS